MAILSTKALSSERSPERDERAGIWLIKMGHVLVRSIFEIFI